TGGAWRTFVAMSDGEQMKGQVGEARRLAAKERLTSLTVLVDLNGIQISGRTSDVMPVRVADDFAADGWRVIEVPDGHDVAALHAAVREAHSDESAPAAIVAYTVIGKGVSFMEGEAEFHGRGPKPAEYVAAMGELGLDPEALGAARERRSRPCTVTHADVRAPRAACTPGAPRTYTRDKDTDCRGAWGAALADLAAGNPDTPMAVLDCDLAVSVKTDGFASARPGGFVQCGVGEHNAAGVASALSIAGVLTFHSDFGVFGIDEVYNQLRLADINGASLKLALTHCGLDVGEDGRTHQCLDHVSAFRNLYGWRVVVPADPNQADRVVRWAAGEPGCIAIAMGRSKVPVVLDAHGAPLFAGDAPFRYGEVAWAREGVDACVLALGQAAGAACDAADALADAGLSVAVGAVSCPLALDDAAMERAVAPPLLVTVEDHNVRSGLGLSVAEWVAEHGCATRLVRLGVERYSGSAPASELLAAAGLDADGIARAVAAGLA
ncbi:MAG: transketolase, partial [Actinobacteria bacterium]